ncbi:MAG: PAS domain-containing protein [Spirochaetales bacterium]|nr:PAS domain-containing protein [Spirochaetales bacterium]
MKQNNKHYTKTLLVESERKLSTLMSNLPGMAYRCRNDEEWTMEFVSDGCRDLTGFEPSDLINNAQIPYACLIHPEDRYRVWTGVNDGIANNKIFKLTYRIISKKGIEKWVFEQGQGVYRENEEPVVEGFITDISERINAENALVKSLSEKDVLMNEIHHRVKNNMQLVISLLSLQQNEASVDLQPFFDQLIVRIGIFADIHQELYQSESFSDINLEQHIYNNFLKLRAVMQNYHKQIDLELDIPDPLFNIDIVIPASLIINELATNSLKHAFDKEHGKISISIRKNPEGSIKTMTYTDDGDKMHNTKEGFGITLIKSLTRQLNLTMISDPTGNIKYSFYM